MSHYYYMDLAIHEAKKAIEHGDVPVGAILVVGGNIIAKDHNRKEELNDPTAHAEILVLRQAAQKLKNWRLSQATLYVTLEPCPMCAGALLQARLKALVYGISDAKFGAIESHMNIVQHPYFNHQVEVLAGIRELEVKEMMQVYFSNLRKEGKE
jgi:tRNA(adenine34) deaminase